MFLLIAFIFIAFAIILVLAYYLLRSSNQLKQVKEQLKTAEIQFLKEIDLQRSLSMELFALKEAVSHNILTDVLTHLPSRGVFEDRLQLTLNQSQRYQLTFAVIFLNLDGFKVINDALGHDAGDILLKEIASRLTECIRQVDTVSRFVGDEFVFILPQLSKAETAAYVAQRVLNAVAQPIRVQEQEIYVTASIGIAIYPTDGNDAKILLKNAATALHQAKSRGRNNYQFYRSEMYAVSQRELILSNSLRSDLVYQDFTVYYQPQVNVEKKEIVCMEALLHWQHPDFGLVTFNEFSRLAENCGKIVAIEEWLLRNSIRHLVKWKSSGFTPNAIAISISSKQLENTHLVHKISNVLQEMHLSPESLVIEISETSLHAEMDQLEKMLHMLKHLGVQLSINNFGTGQLSLQHLRRLPVDSLKIDASFIQDVTVNKESGAIVKMIVALAKSLQLTVIANGVESIKQKQFLTEQGCVIMQGPLFGKPAMAQDFTSAFLKNIYS